LRGFLLHTAADVTNLGVVGPIFSDGTFEFIPINNEYGVKTKSYNRIPAKNKEFGKMLSDFLPSTLSDWAVHFDPNFDNFTYGQPVDNYPRSRVLENLKSDDVIFFVSSLAPYDNETYANKDTFLKHYQIRRKNKYVFGFFTVQGVARVTVLKSEPKLALPLLSIASFQENGEQLIDLDSAKESLDTLERWEYIAREGGDYKLTTQCREIGRSGEEIASELLDKWSNDEKDQATLLEKGYLNITTLSGSVTEEDVKLSQHYTRLRPLDWDQFVLIKGNPQKSAILNKAVQLTNGFESFSFALNNLGQTILNRKNDTLRGFRWINEYSVKLLIEVMNQSNSELLDKLPFL